MKINKKILKIQRQCTIHDYKSYYHTLLGNSKEDSIRKTIKNPNN